MDNRLKSIIDIAKSQVGYKENGTNNTKYAKYFDTDAWQFFNTKKNGTAWCSIFIHWCFCQVFKPSEVRKMFGEPDPKNNCAAGVDYFYAYLKKKGYTFSKSKKEPKAGDVIFFGSKTDLDHVGLVESVDDKVHTIEGNKSNSVKKCTYTKTSSKIQYYARIELPTAVSVQPFKIEPAVSFDKYYARSYEVTCNCQLMTAVRKNVKVITVIKKGSSVRCYGYYTSNFLYVKYGNYEGYICKNHLR